MNGLVKWNLFEHHSIKRHLLLFDKLYYDHTFQQMINISCLNFLKDIIKKDEVLAENLWLRMQEHDALTNYLITNNILIRESIFERQTEYFRRKYLDSKENSQLLFNSELDKLHSMAFNGGKFEELKSIKSLEIWQRKTSSIIDNISRYGSELFKQMKITNTIPVVDNITDINKGSKETVIKLVIDQIPFPSNTTPFDELIDFKKSSENRLRYKALTRWISKISTGEHSFQELEDELEYLLLSFENRMKLENMKYNLTNVSTIFKIPLELIENIVKFKWSKIPETLLSFKIHKVNLLIGESKAEGKEIAYLNTIKKNFN